MGTRQPRLRWERTADAIRTFVTRYGELKPRRAVLCTYDFDANRFGAVLLPELTRRGKQFRTLVMCDAGAIQDKLGTRLTFGRYELARARCLNGGVFHAKIVLLQAGDRFLAGVGSANLTPGGLGKNLELMMFLDNSNDDGCALLGGVARFLRRVRGCADVAIPTPARTFIDAILAVVRDQRGIVLDSLEQPLLDQMRALRGKAIGEARITLDAVSPWHSHAVTEDCADAKMITRLREQLGVAGSVTIYTDVLNGGAPDLGPHAHVKVLARPETPEADEEGDDDSVSERACNQYPSTLHAKAYLLRGSSRALLFFGSANCTVPALTRPVSKGGNVEVLVPVSLSLAEAATVENDLRKLFDERRKTIAPQPTVRPLARTGVILGGWLSANRSGPILKIEAPRIDGEAVRIAPARGSKQTVRVAIDKGIGRVDDGGALERLFPAGPPQRSDESWVTVLWEEIGHEWAAFPVTVPLAVHASGRPDDALLEILEEELGLWPACRIGSGQCEAVVEGEEDDAQPSDEEDRELTDAKHQGELDRIAIAVARLRRVVHARFKQPRERINYPKVLRQRIGDVDLPKHVRTEIFRFLESSAHPQRKCE